MKDDIKIPIVEGISVAVVKEWNEEKTSEVYNVYLLNLRKELIENVLVSSVGYGENKTTGEKVKTSSLRHFIGNMESNSFAKVEPIVEEVFGINNEYWVSFFSGEQMYDKKFIFLAESIREDNFISVPLMDSKGVVI